MGLLVVHTRGEYPFLLPFLVEEVVSRKQVAEDRMDWLVMMSEQEVEGVRRRPFVESMQSLDSSVSL